MWIIWYTCVVNDANLLQSNPVSIMWPLDKSDPDDESSRALAVNHTKY